jgi:probable phosphoglycerate mutase
LRHHLQGRTLPAYTSPLRRAAHTAELALLPLGQQARPDSRLKELNFGTREGKARAEVAKSRKLSRFEHYFSDPQGESFADIETRCRSFLDDLDGESVVITHGVRHAFCVGYGWGCVVRKCLIFPLAKAAFTSSQRSRSIA